MSDSALGARSKTNKKDLMVIKRASQMPPLFLHNQVVSAKMALHTFHADFGDHKATLTAIFVDGVPWFRGIEAAASIGHKDPRKAIYTHVGDEDKYDLSPGLLTKSSKITSLHISERGLCSLLTSSKQPHTKAVQNWVLNSVLPTIRQMNGYIAHPVLEDVEPTLPDAQRVHADALSSSSSSSGNFVLEPAYVELYKEYFRKIADATLDQIGKQQNPMIDASEFLMRKGHEALEVNQLFCGFQRSLKNACQRNGRADSVTFHAHSDATFLETEYSDFKRSELYQRVCVARGDQNSRGSAVTRERSLRRQRAV